MVKIKRQISKNTNHYGTGNTKRSITIHETDNWSYGSNAQAHANLIDNGFSSTWHYSVDDIQAIQSFEHDIRCWHGGDGRRSDGGNYSSIAIEICVNRDGNYLKAVNNAIELVQHIMEVENIPVDRVYQHNNWSGKHCPRSLRNNDRGISWNEFIARIKSDKIPKLDVSNINDLVNRTIAGEFGNGNTRKKLLGKDYTTVQKLINEKFKNKNNKVDYDDLVKRTIAGEFGNGDTRKKLLGSHYSKVQALVNKKLR